MKRLLYPVLALLLLVGCAPGMPSLPGLTNKPPTAYIDSISPSTATTGQKVTFQGHGTDTDGTVVAYRWRSSLDGDLSTMATFETSSLSAGTHTIYLKVQDNADVWSTEVQGSVTISGAAATLPVVNSFDASPATVAPGGSSTLSWNVTGATSVSIDQGVGSVALAGSRVVTPAATTIYKLTAKNDAGSSTAATQVMVSGLPPPVVDATPPSVPVLTSPTSGAVLPQKTAPWVFNWNDSTDPESGIKQYELRVYRLGSPPFIDVYTTVSQYSDTVEVAYPYISNWRWSVRVQNNAGLWSSWSSERTFSVQPRAAYDFIEKAPTAYWWSGPPVGPQLPFPGSDVDNNGFALYRSSVQLNDSNVYVKVLETHPKWVTSGWISGKYSGVTVPSGARLKIKVGFIKGGNAGLVRFQVAKLGEAAVLSFVHSYAGGVVEKEVALDAYAGQTIDFVLNVNAEGSSSQDWAAWAFASIVY